MPLRQAGHGARPLNEPATVLNVRVQPRARADEIVGERGDALLVRVTAPPEGGRANDAVRRVIARRLRVGVTRVEIVRGGGSRDKVVRVAGVPQAEAEHALGL